MSVIFVMVKAIWMTNPIREQLEDLLVSIDGHVSDRAQEAIIQLLTQQQAVAVLRGKIEELSQLDEWFQQYGYEMHVSHVCPEDSIECAQFKGRSQKANQIHKKILDRLAELQKELDSYKENKWPPKGSFEAGYQGYKEGEV